VVLNVIFWCALIFSIPTNGYNPLYGFAAIGGVLVMAVFAGMLLLLTKGREHAGEYLRSITKRLPFIKPEKVEELMRTIAVRIDHLLKDRSLLRRAVLWATLNWLLDAASLWVFLLAFGHVTFPIDLLVAYGLANILAAIPLTPGGLGIVEAVLIPTLVGFHMPKAVATLGVLGYRLINFWIPIPIGGAAYISLRVRKSRLKGSNGDAEAP
jgi:uncharacterized protein (TIRG00374 family)